MERMRTDSEIEQWVLHELNSEPVLGSKEICVQSNEGVVTLSGSIRNRDGKLAAAQATSRVLGIAGVVNDMKVAPRRRINGMDSPIVVTSKGLKPLVSLQEIEHLVAAASTP